MKLFDLNLKVQCRHMQQPKRSAVVSTVRLHASYSYITTHCTTKKKAKVATHLSCNMQIMAAWQFGSCVPRHLDGWKFAIDRLERHLAAESEGKIHMLLKLKCTTLSMIFAVFVGHKNRFIQSKTHSSDCAPLLA